MNKKTEVNVEEDEEKGTKTKEFTFHIVFCVVGLYKGTWISISIAYSTSILLLSRVKNVITSYLLELSDT